MSDINIHGIPDAPGGYDLTGKEIMVHDPLAPLESSTVLVPAEDFAVPMTLDPVGNTPNVNAATINGVVLNLEPANATFSGVLKAADWTTFNGKQAALVSGTNIKTINGSSILGPGDLVGENIYNTDGALTGNRTLTGAGNYLALSGIRFQEAKGANIAAANNLTLGNDGNTFVITGNTQINAVTNANWQAGSQVAFIFTGTPKIKHNTAGGAGTSVILLSGSVDYTAATDDVLELVYDGTRWHETTRKIVAAGGGKGTTETASNGLTKVVNDIQLGGTISTNTIVTLDGKNLLFTGTNIYAHFKDNGTKSILFGIGTDGDGFLINDNTNSFQFLIIDPTNQTYALGDIGGVGNNTNIQINDFTERITFISSKTNINTISNYANNAAAVSGGLSVGDLYRNGDVLQIVH